ncbi:hypothetical protein [Oceanidesulfovibrio marinus]|uniref:Uncharacterized protein n=1 Tax=Oceanidesulfovibrio marinus TaxID=370038 RepID=A0A6P1ZA40_9BACT|nr:hypothetical protein [Oceanidesulfovibrio marinus]TVM30455.1 hypothetical protein DQK91_20945 [Oceanidesulfovibrio marinus]
MKKYRQNGNSLTSTTIRLGHLDRERIQRIHDCYQNEAGAEISMARLLAMGLRSLEREIASGRGFLALEEK